ncbi:myosin light chain kinase, smooth muscle isoform X2 [Coccinella septempunctata]|uniref:myosin light chain kinase, smooth muscle isoform X2 n=1 Tax=Coccinella septempunctata TaxID=41139 RepID=UPI001D0771B8|nr:myosin light chain kinase, smooth muscle isoform X2 [Coccinella septempunctata]
MRDSKIELSFPYRDVQIKRGVDPKEEYNLQEELGRGKFGIVYRCTEKKSGLTLAAKFINCPKKEDRRNVEREVDIMKTLQHPRLIQMYDAYENGKIMCVILELIEGGELFERVIDDDFVLTEKSCTIFMRQICEGVDFMHKQRILHLDMKPENILCLTKTGNRVKIIDFGLARRFDPEKKLQVLFGTPEFVAPEVVNYDSIGYGTDMWSVGVICYVLLSGLSPFMGANDPQTMANVTIAKYDFDDEAFNEISETAKDFIRKLLVKDMTARMSAEECLNHDWLKRKKRPVTRTPSMEVTKDNLKLFVERWNEHPNSPYIFDKQSQFISPVCSGGHKLTDSLHSLVGLSPSPCGSLASSTGLDDYAFSDVQPIDFDRRRASDSHGVVTPRDITERINLAEEIRKLSDKLYQLSKIPTTLNNDKCSLGEPPISPTSNGDHQQTNGVLKSVPIQILHTKYEDIPKGPVNCDVPWRKTKFKLNQFSRDVPLAVKHLNGTKTYSATVKYNSVQRAQTDSTPNTTKDLLLTLLEHWDGPHGTKRQNTRHSSISSEWSESEQSLGQKTISSLNNFFQSRAASKKITPFHQFEN